MVGSIAIGCDNTERWRAEEELRKNEHFLSSIFESIHDRFFVIDCEFNIIRTNKKVEQSFPHALPLAGKKCYRVYHGQNDVCEGCPSAVTLKSGQSAHAIIPVRDQSGNVTGWLDHYCYPYIDKLTGELMGVIVYARDITQKLRMEQEMARLERLNLIGQMAAGIGHEIRNPITAVKGLLQLLESKAEFSRYSEYLKLMISELDRANSIITQYLSLARNKPVDLVQHSLNAILEVMRPLIEAEAMNAGADVRIEAGDIKELYLNENEIRQLILNLVKNGLEAMESGGCLTIRTFMDGGDVVLSVKDEGKGMEAGVIDKIGTPFFTTKENGTGLGLAVCHGIAVRHNAVIKIETGKGGTAVNVRFCSEMPEGVNLPKIKTWIDVQAPNKATTHDTPPTPPTPRPASNEYAEMASSGLPTTPANHCQQHDHPGKNGALQVRQLAPLPAPLSCQGKETVQG